MTNKKLIFIVSSPRSGSTLLLSYLCGIPNTKILYESKVFEILQGNISQFTKDCCLKTIANYFDSFKEEIVIEKTPEHCFHLEDIERLRGLCKRDIYIVYIVRPPVPTILSIIKASKDSPESFGHIDLLGACEKYEESLVAIYNNLILKSNLSYTYQEKMNVSEGFTHSDGNYFDIVIPYSLGVSYRELIKNPYKVIHSLIDDLYIDLSIEVDIQYLIDNRVSNVEKYLPIVSTEKHHVNVLRDIKDVEVERRVNISKQINEGFSERYIERSNYIRNYFEHPISKETIYDLVVNPSGTVLPNKKVLELNKTPLVTVIVPLYNKEKYIRDTLDSLLYQTYENLRVLVIDDASTDKSLEIVEDFRDSLPPELQIKLCILHNDSNQGVSYTRNLSLSLIFKGDIYSFCDADDTWDKELVAKSIKVYEKYPYVDCVYSRVLKDGIEDKSKICNGHVFKDAIQYNFLGCGSNLFVKSQILENNEDLRFDESYSGCEDWDFLIQLSKVAVFKCTKEYLVTYRQNVKNSLSSNTKNQYDQGRNILAKYTEDKKQYSRLVTRLFFFYLCRRNFTWENIKELDFRFILGIVLDKCKSFVKRNLP